MTSAFVSFEESVAEACGRLQAASDREHLRFEYDYRSGVLRGYYFAGVISDVELKAALDQLREIHHARFVAIAPDRSRESKPRARSAVKAGA